jgi:hypothetical protein
MARYVYPNYDAALTNKDKTLYIYIKAKVHSHEGPDGE